MYRISPQRLQELQHEAKERNTAGYRRKRIEQMRRQEANKKLLQDRAQRREARKARKEAKKWQPKPVDWEKVKKYL